MRLSSIHVGILLITASMSTAIFACADLAVSKAWIRRAPPKAMMQAGFVTLSNTSKDQAITIGKIKSVDFGLIELHTTIEVDGVARMKQIDPVTIAPGQSHVFKPGRDHFMLMRPTRVLQLNDVVKIKLTLCKKHRQTIEFKVLDAEP
jgi:periplasmic copper chaperone A